MLLGLAHRRSLLLPTWKGWLFILTLGIASTVLLVRQLYPYLAADSRLEHADVALVEGWVSDQIVALAKAELDARRCQLICTAGVDLDQGHMLVEWKDWAILAAETLKALGVPEEKILVASAGGIQRHRTYAGFESAKDKLLALNLPAPIRINVITEGAHGKRSLTVARKVFGSTATVGLISAEPLAYDPKRWWASSSGLKAVFMELVGSTYERFADSGR